MRWVIGCCLAAALTCAAGCAPRLPWQPPTSSLSVPQIEAAYIRSDDSGPPLPPLSLTADQVGLVVGWLHAARGTRVAQEEACQPTEDGALLVLQVAGQGEVDIGHVWTCQVVARTARSTTVHGTLSAADVRVQFRNGRWRVLRAPGLAAFLSQEQQALFQA